MISLIAPLLEVSGQRFFLPSIGLLLFQVILSTVLAPIVDHLSTFEAAKERLWLCIICAVLWKIWEERNARIFWDKNKKTKDIIDTIIQNVFFGAKIQLPYIVIVLSLQIRNTFCTDWAPFVYSLIEFLFHWLSSCFIQSMKLFLIYKKTEHVSDSKRHLALKLGWVG